MDDKTQESIIAKVSDETQWKKEVEAMKRILLATVVQDEIATKVLKDLEESRPGTLAGLHLVFLTLATLMQQYAQECKVKSDLLFKEMMS